MELEDYLNASFRQFLEIASIYGLVRKNDLAPLMELISNFGFILDDEDKARRKQSPRSRSRNPSCTATTATTETSGVLTQDILKKTVFSEGSVKSTDGLKPGSLVKTKKRDKLKQSGSTESVNKKPSHSPPSSLTKSGRETTSTKRTPAEALKSGSGEAVHGRKKSDLESTESSENVSGKKKPEQIRSPGSAEHVKKIPIADTKKPTSSESVVKKYSSRKDGK